MTSPFGYGIIPALSGSYPSQDKTQARVYSRGCRNKTISSVTAEIARDAHDVGQCHSRSSVVMPIDTALLALNSNLTSIFNRS